MAGSGGGEDPASDGLRIAAGGGLEAVGAVPGPAGRLRRLQEATGLHTVGSDQRAGIAPYPFLLT